MKEKEKENHGDGESGKKYWNHGTELWMVTFYHGSSMKETLSPVFFKRGISDHKLKQNLKWVFVGWCDYFLRKISSCISINVFKIPKIIRIIL